MKNIYPHKDLKANVSNSIIHNKKEWEQSKLYQSVNEQMWYISIRTTEYYSAKLGRELLIHANMCEPQKHVR